MIILLIYIYIYKEQEELFRILESNNLSDSLEDDFSSLSDSCYQSADDSSDSPNIKIGGTNSFCNVIKFVNTLTKGEENERLIIQLINQIQNPNQPYTSHSLHALPGLNGPYSSVMGIHVMTRVAPMTVRREHNKGVPKFQVNTDRETMNTTTLSPAGKEWL